MHFPFDINIGSVVVPIHLITDALSFYFGYRYFLYLRNKKGDHITEDNRWWLIIGAAGGALIGSRLLAALEFPSLFFNPPSLIFYYANKTIIGGVVGGIIGVEIAKKIIGEKKSSGDLFTFPLLMAIVVGRIGCFLTGVKDGTAGSVSNLPWAIDQGDGLLRHPTSLYEILYLLVLWPIFYYLNSKNSFRDGELFKYFIVVYLGFRFFIEFIKPVEVLVFGLSAIQIACVITVLVYLFQLWKSKIQ